MTFWIIMSAMIIAVIALIVIGEDRFNRWFRCRHDWNYTSYDGGKTICKKCGRDAEQENKE